MKLKRTLPLILALLMAGGVFASGCVNNEKPDNGDGNNTEQGGGGNQGGEGEGEGEGGGNQGGEGEGGEEGDKDTSTALPADNKIYMVGDSTMCDYVKSDGTHSDKDTYYVVRYGYGTQMENYLNVTSDQVVNLALSGRSSLSFLSEANYTTLKNSIGEGDYLIIGFGHNDQKTDRKFYTNANLGTDDETTENGASFKHTLYENYIKLAEDAGATPILCTPIVRYHEPSNNNSDVYAGSSGHITDTKTVLGVEYLGGDYPKAIRELASEKEVALVDLTAITKEIYVEQGTGALQYHAYNSYDDSTGTKIPAIPDTTHLNELGAKMVAYQFAQAIKKTDCPLKNQVRSLATAPTYENDFNDKTNENFVKPTADTFDPSKASTIWDGIEAEGWYGTVFGSVGGQDKITATNFELTGSGNSFTINCKTGNGKFASGEEGMAAIFMQIDATKDFTAEVTATLTGTGDNQSSFGLMLRDDIYIDKNDKSVKSNYISAGLLNGSAIFMRNSEGSRVLSGNSVSMVDTGVYTLRIVKSGDEITATVIYGGQTYSHTYTSADVSLVASDSRYVYLCMYAVRTIRADFTNVNVVVDE